MPFKVDYSAETKATFRDLKPMEMMAARKLIGSFRHDRWLNGRPLPGLASQGKELMELQNGPIRLVYELNRVEESLVIRAIVFD